MTDPSSPTSASLPPREFFRQPFALLLVALAAFFLVIALWALASKSSISSQLDSERSQRAELAQNLQDLQTRVGSSEALSKSAEQAKNDLAKFEAAKEIAEAQSQSAGKDLQTVQARLTGLKEEADRLAAQSAEIAKAMGESETRHQALTVQLADLNKSIGARSNEVAEVGARLVAAREDEAKLRTTLGQLNQQAAARAEEAASAEQRIQAARKVEAQAQEQLTFVRTQLSELEQRLATLTREFGRRSEEVSPNSRDEIKEKRPAQSVTDTKPANPDPAQ